jgi:predicted enzyme related to lactoylglutathione lyase
VYFSCEDCAVEEARVAENGWTVHQSKMSIGEHGYVTMVRDTEWNMIWLHSQQ